MTKQTKIKRIAVSAPLKLDLGCGNNKMEGFTGVDSRQFDAVDAVLDLAAKKNGKFVSWPWADESVDAIHSSHFVEHLDAEERVHFVNEMHRILKKGGQVQIIAPHWSSCRAYGDLTHKWPPVSEFWFYYLSKEWRASNAPHNDTYTCDFDAAWGYSLHNDVLMKNQEYQAFAITFYKEAAQDVIVTLTKR